MQNPPRPVPLTPNDECCSPLHQRATPAATRRPPTIRDRRPDDLPSDPTPAFRHLHAAAQSESSQSRRLGAYRPVRKDLDLLCVQRVCPRPRSVRRQGLSHQIGCDRVCDKRLKGGWDEVGGGGGLRLRDAAHDQGGEDGDPPAGQQVTPPGSVRASSGRGSA